VRVVVRRALTHDAHARRSLATGAVASEYWASRKGVGAAPDPPARRDAAGAAWTNEYGGSG